jgi:hypothetical protein
MEQKAHEFQEGNKVMVEGDQRKGHVYEILVVSHTGNGQGEVLLKGMCSTVPFSMLIPA